MTFCFLCEARGAVSFLARAARVSELFSGRPCRCVISVERRNNVRYQLKANAVFTWKGAGSEFFRCEGFTRDLSITGAFILAPSQPPPDIVAELDIFLPPTHGEVPTTRIKAECRVMRIEPGSVTRGFAVSCSGFKFWPVYESKIHALSRTGQFV